MIFISLWARKQSRRGWPCHSPLDSPHCTTSSQDSNPDSGAYEPLLYLLS